MATGHEHWYDDLPIRIITYLTGAILGVGAKLAIKYKKKKIEWRVAIAEGFIAGAAAFAVWQALTYYGKTDLAGLCAVIVGRYGESIIIGFWIGLKKAFRLDDENE